MLVISLFLCILLVVLRRIFFGPIGRIIEEREKLVASDLRTLQDNIQEIEAKTKFIEEKIAAGRQDTIQIRERWLRQGEESGQRLIEDARQRSARVLEERMQQLERELSQAEGKLAKGITLFVEKMRESLL